MENLTGQSIKGYDLQERIGSGGFGAVYRAFQTTVGREVAIKIILPGFASHPDFIRRFETEARIIARLEHPYITPLFDYWREPDGAYLVMRWLRGGSLRDALQKQPFDTEAAALLLDQITAALSVAHRNNIIHRDLKPGNILLDEDGNAYLADFGIAKDIGSPGNTEIDAVLGSPDYLSPEQARSEPVTPQADIYSLGVVLHEMLTGEHPFPNLSAVERLYKHLSDPLPQITHLPDHTRDNINAVVQKATAKNPVLRYPDALSLASAFREAIQTPTPQNIVEMLTVREQEILQRVIAGQSNRQIATDLVVTVGTVKWYITQIYRKLNVRSRVQAIVRARELNLITSGMKNGGASILVTAIPTSEFKPENPYKGLRAFQTADEHDFFGRETLIEKLVNRLAETSDFSRFLAIVGPSGSGKSSLVKAGLIPAFWRGSLPGSEKWFVIEMLPGARPLDELEIALSRVAASQTGSLHEQLERDRFGLLRCAALVLPDDGSELVLVIDQFEEVFSAVADEKARIHFLSLLQTAVTEPRSRVRVVVTLRADFYDRPLQYPEFGELIRSRMETVLPLNVKGLEQAITKPAEQVGVRFEDGLVTSIVTEMNYQTGALPLLQYALMELFDRRSGRLLTQAAYQEIGGAVGALAKRAEQIYSELTPDGQESARQLFLRLVTLGKGVGDTRRRVALTELLALAANTDLMDEIIDTFAEYRLLSLDHDPGTRTPTVEVAHEAILREWERLRSWLNASREDIRVQRQLAALATEWQASGNDASFLTRGTRLESFEKWEGETTLGLTLTERNYLQASVSERGRQVAAETARQVRETHLERRSQTFLRGLVTVLLLATLGAFGLTGAAINASQRAEAQARVAQSRELVGYSRDTLDSDGELSTLLALQAVNMTYNMDKTVLPEAEAGLHQAVEAMRTPLQLSPPGEGSDVNVGFRFTGSGALVAYHLKTGDVFGAPSVTGIADAVTGKLLYQLPGGIVALVPGKNQIITSVFVDGEVVIEAWDISSRDHGTLVSTVTEPHDIWHDTHGNFGAQFGESGISPDLHTEFVSMADGHNRIWDLTTGHEVVTAATQKILEGNGLPLYSPDATRLANRNPDGTLSILDTTTWEEIAHLSPPNTTISGDFRSGFSGDSKRIATPNTNDTITIWDTASGAELYTIYPGFAPRLVALDNDGTRVAAGTNAGKMIIWNTTTKKEEFALGVSHDASSIAFNPDGTRLAVSHGYGNEIWDLALGREALTLVNTGSDEAMASVGLAYSPDGKRLLASGTSTTPNVWDVQTGHKLLTLAGHTGRVRAADWSPDGTLLATGSEDQNVIVWNATTGAVRFTLTGHTNTVFAIAFSPDSRRLASASLDGSLRIWDVYTGELVFTVTQEGVQASRGVAWSPDGLHIAITTLGIDARHGAHLYILNAFTGETEHDTALGDTGIGHLRYSSDGTRIAAAMSDGQAYDVFDAHTGEKLLTLPGHGVTTTAIAFSPDGSLIATGGLDNLAQLWDANTGKERLQLPTPLTTTYRLAFSPDGTYLAIEDNDSTTRIYVVHIEDLIVLAKSRLTRTFTSEECQQFLHTNTCPAG